MKLQILKNTFLKERYFLMELVGPAHLPSAVPGQFLHIRMGDSCDPFLRRPLSIHDVVKLGRKNQWVTKILYEVKGKGTRLLSEKKSLMEIDCLGCLGNGFDLKAMAGKEKAYLVAGGMGVAPLFFLAKKIVEIQKPKSKIQTVVLIGAKTKNQILCEKEFKALGCEVKIATEDGSKGFKGRVTDLLKEVLPQATSHKPQAIFACGPRAMLAVVSEIAQSRHLPAQVSLEEFMGCGLGACLCCAIRTTSGYRRICHDGPVFHAEDIIWKE